MRRKLEWFREPPEEELERIVSALNTLSDPAKERTLRVLGLTEVPSTEGVLPLRSYVEAWLESGPNLQRFAKKHPRLWARVRQPWAVLYEKPVLMATDSGMAEILWTPASSPSSEHEALKFFVSLITNPLWEKLGGPCARCGKYFVRKTARNPKVYCSRSCATKNTALAATKKAREQEHTDKLRRAAEAVHEYSRTRTHLNWKEWVSRRNPGITPRFLTRAVNNGELAEPVRTSLKEK